MCGIAGWLNWERDLRKEQDIAGKMANCQHRRGPDESGEWYSEHIALAHRRLVVIDPTGGKQPMEKRYQADRYVMVYNGELYNTEDLRKELKQEGHSFEGHSDTEVLLTAYIAWGSECVKKLNGIYAFAIWDSTRERLFLARDRIGVKPLFYTQQDNGFLFASELKGLLVHPEVEAEIDEEGLAEVFAVGPGRTPGHGVIKGVKELKPGYSMVVNRYGIKEEQYWELESKSHQDDLETTITRVRDLFVDTVERQLVSDVPICTLLSGGLDSSAITSIASRAFMREGKGRIDTYSVDYEGNEDYFEANEFQPAPDDLWIKKMSDYADTNHHYIRLKNDKLVESLREGVYARDLPGMADIDVSLYLFCKEIKKNFTVGVSGECADEIFGGYPWYHSQEALKANTFPWSRKLEERVKILSGDLINRINPQEYMEERYLQALSEVPTLKGENAEDARMREIFYLNLTRWMPTLLDRKDRMSMYTGLEVRVPFCDHRLVEYVWNIPWEMKNVGGKRKGILREALKGVLPEEVRLRPKNPYPKTFDPAYFDATRDWLLEILNNSNSPIIDLLDVTYIRKLTESDGDFDIPWFGQLMRLPQLFAYLIQVNLWLDEYGVKII
ncbi:asparagine synthase (glutamine-hydrolyzing) [Orenia marismortui]|uniref:asparagine synthase (glutamine-hydrolyzing) n=1 Tax=Orenia marismortui TaxID=46469 RepID=A0A4V3GYH8_9FIRM|nr:asparagine synthase (glutamine-hydrolyzing) [Orenia marismortui]TDX52695.1 asparagine synthase (glutamine-hydrolysing) [Orenia marismortui]